MKSIVGGVFDALASAWSRVMGVMKSVYDKTLGPVFSFLKDGVGAIIDGLLSILNAAKDIIGGSLGKVFNFGKSIVGGAKNLVTGGGGGGSTTVGTSVQGGVVQTFNITIDVSGVTDRSDKRAMAREMGDLIQEELARSMGGVRQRGRYA